MKIEVILTPAELPALAKRDLRDSACVVFDVLRATSTFVTALHNGAVSVVPVAEISEAVHGADFIIGAMPSAHARALYSEILPHAAPSAVIVSATKGLEPESHLRMTQVIAALIIWKHRENIARLIAGTENKLRRKN